MAAGAVEAGARWRAIADELGTAIATRPTTDSPANRTWRMTSTPGFRVRGVPTSNHMRPRQAFTNLWRPHGHSHRRHRRAWPMPEPCSWTVRLRWASTPHQRRHPIGRPYRKWSTSRHQRQSIGYFLPQTISGVKATRAWFAPDDRGTAATKAAVPIRETQTRRRKSSLLRRTTRGGFRSAHRLNLVWK